MMSVNNLELELQNCNLGNENVNDEMNLPENNPANNISTQANICCEEILNREEDDIQGLIDKLDKYKTLFDLYKKKLHKITAKNDFNFMDEKHKGLKKNHHGFEKHGHGKPNHCHKIGKHHHIRKGHHHGHGKGHHHPGYGMSHHHHGHGKGHHHHPGHGIHHHGHDFHHHRHGMHHHGHGMHHHGQGMFHDKGARHHMRFKAMSLEHQNDKCHDRGQNNNLHHEPQNESERNKIISCENIEVEISTIE